MLQGLMLLLLLISIRHFEAQGRQRLWLGVWALLYHEGRYSRVAFVAPNRQGAAPEV